MAIALDLDNYQGEPSTRRALYGLSLSVAKCKKIVVVTGAGISCSCGIPDFRSSDGLYALVKQQYPDVVLKGRDLFDASLFRDSTSTAVFYTFISQLKQSIDRAAPSPTHKFIKTLDAKRKLLRSYTQNIDGLEEQAGLLGSSSEQVRADMKGKSRAYTKDVKNVQLHGDIHRVRCTLCSADLLCTPEYLDLFDRGVPPDCPECATRSQARQARSARALKVGTLRPAIVLYDEPHPLGDDIGTMQTTDLARKPDLLIIMGTSLKVHGFKKLVKEFARAVHDSAPTTVNTAIPGKTPNAKAAAKNYAGKVIFVNKTAPGAEWDGIIDYWVQGESDRWVEKVTEDWKKAIPGDWETQKTLDASGGLKVMKELNSVGGLKQKKGVKKKENVPPRFDDISFALALSTPLPLTPPSSPGKRTIDICHYSSDSDSECSPSKKQRAPSSRGLREEDVGGKSLLFGDNTNNARGGHDGDGDAPSGSKGKGRPRAKSRVGAPAKVASSSKSSASAKPPAVTQKTKTKVPIPSTTRRTRTSSRTR